MESDSGKSPSSKTEIQIPNFPVIKLADNAKLLPCYYSTILKKITDGKGVRMEDLDQLQQDLEKLLSTCAVRYRMLKEEADEEKRGEKRKSPAKQKRPKNRFKVMESENRVRILKAKIQPKLKPSKQPRSKIVGQFWQFVDQFCRDVTTNDVIFLDNLIQQCSEDVDGEIPELGKHYALEWTQEIIGKDSLSNSIKLPETKGLLTQRSVSNFIEENIMTKLPILTDKLKPSDLSCLKTLNLSRFHCMQGVLKSENVPKVLTADDAILQEIKKCRQELSAINEFNVQQLNKLKSIVRRDQRKLNVKIPLRKIDKQVEEMYKKLLLAKQNAAQDDDGLLPKQCHYINPVEVDKLIEQQTKLSNMNVD